MPDREYDDLPQRAFPLVLPAPQGFEAAVRRGRNIRRHRTMGAGAGAMTLMIGVLGASLLSHGPAGTQRINPTNPTGPDSQYVPYNPGVRSMAPSTPPSEVSEPASTHVSDGTGAVPGTNGSAVVRQPDGSTDGTPGDTVPKGPVVPKTSKPKMSGAFASQPNPCPPVVNPPEAGWCMDVSVTNQGSALRLDVQVCRDINRDQAGGLVFRTAQEADFRIVNTNRTDVWQWSVGQVFGAHSPESITVQKGECYHWWVDWNVTDERGKAVPSGSYTLQAWTTADGFEGRAPVEYSFGV